jgi:hypothetical protein
MRSPRNHRMGVQPVTLVAGRSGQVSTVREDRQAALDAALEPAPGTLRRWVRAHSIGLLLSATLGTGAAVRLVNLNALGFNSDEAVYAGQAAALAGNPAYELFPMFRAHPMLVQSILSWFFAEGEHDLVGRVVVALLGVVTLLVVYLLGKELYTPQVGVLAAAILAVMPYHVVVTRQVLLDGPMVLAATATLLFVVKYAKTGRLAWMLAAGAALGLTMLAKESSVVLVGAVYVFFALTPGVRRPVSASLLGFAVAVSLFALHPISVALSGHVSTTKAYLVWQLVRRPNHSFSFYFDTVPWAVGPLVLIFAAVAVWLVRRRKQPGWREVLLVAWIVVPTAAFTIWPTKGFQYLLPCAPALAVLAARGLLSVRWRLPGSIAGRAWFRHASPGVLRGLAVAAVLLSLVAVLLPRIGAEPSASGLAGSGGVPGGREAGQWIGENTPEGAVIMTVGPSMANIIQFYGHRKAYGLSVSPNPLNRNPSYEPIPNPDYALRHGDMQYVVWDVWSAKRSKHFSRTLKTLARRYNGRVVHTEYIGTGADRISAIVIYEVRA